MAGLFLTAMLLLFAVIASVCWKSAAVSCDAENEKRVMESITAVLTASKDAKFGNFPDSITLSKESSVTILDSAKIKIECSTDEKNTAATYKITAKTADDNIATFAIKGTFKQDESTDSVPFEYINCLRKIEAKLSGIERLTVRKAEPYNSDGNSCKPGVTTSLKKDELWNVFRYATFIWDSKGLSDAVLKRESDLLHKDPAKKDLAVKVADCATKQYKAMKFPLADVPSETPGIFQIFCSPAGFSQFYYELKEKKTVSLVSQSEMKKEETLMGCLEQIEPSKQPALKNKLSRIYTEMLEPICTVKSLITALAGKDKQLKETADTIILALNSLRLPVSLLVESGEKLELKIDCRSANGVVVGLELDGSAVSHIGDIEERNPVMTNGPPKQTKKATIDDIVEKSVAILKEKKKDMKSDVVKKNIETLLSKACAVKPLLRALADGF